MFVVIASICFGFLTGVASTPPDYILEFPKKGITDFVQVWGMRDLTQFTVCFMMKTTSEKGTIFSYASNGVANDLLIDFTNGKFLITLGDVKVDTDVVANDGKLNQICVTWCNTDGQWTLYKDGEVEKKGKGLKTGYTIRAGGCLTLGQEQDKLGGGFEADQSFQGMMMNVNVWSYVIPSPTIKEISKCCLAGKGDVYEWAHFIYGIKGNPHLLMPAGCTCCC